MQCNKCNAFIPEGYMYCPVCGEEIIIVTDFEIKLEDNIDTAAIAKTVELPDVNKEIEDKIKTSKTQEIIINKDLFEDIEKKKKINPKLWILIGISGLVFIGLCILIGIQISRYYSYDYQYKKGRIEADSQDYQSAIDTLKHVVTLGNDKKGQLLLADCYFAVANYDAALAVLFNALQDYPDDLGIYDKIVDCYKLEGDSDGIHELITNSNDSALALRYSEYISLPPSFSLESGTYIEPSPIKIIASDEGTIYYTTDGSEPNSASFEYMGPIPLDPGTTTISAIFINKNGIVSDVVTNEYNVEIVVPDVPQLLVPSGTLNKPQLIGVTIPAGETVYYTSSGADPDNNSTEYTSPFLMPLGKSSYKFIAYNSDGTASDIIVANYNLELKALINTATAEYAIQYQLLSMGNNVLANSYKSEYAYDDGNRVCYVIYEYLDKSRTGRIFAVDINSGELFVFSKESNGYRISPL